jgi:hypothetical protein
LPGKQDWKIYRGIFQVHGEFILAYEHKLSKMNGIGAGMGVFFKFDEYRKLEDKVLQFDIRYKYFYNLHHRMSLGKTGNNFSADYILISPGITLTKTPYEISGYLWDFTQGYWVAHYKREVVMDPRLKIGYGIQRELRKRIVLDINAGIQAGKFSYTPHFYDLLFGQVTLGFIIK